MNFWDHLDELRVRFIRCLYIFFIGFIAFYFVSDHILGWIKKPLFDYLPPDKQKLYYTALFENFFVHLKVAGYASLVFLSPIYFWILWGFVSPALYEKEKKTIFPFVFAASFFFLLGAGFSYFVLFPTGVKYFLTYGTESEVALLTLDHYVSLVLKMMFGFGVCFQLPVILILLAKLEIISIDQMQKHRRTAMIIVAIVSAVVAPPDAISMLMLMAPLYLLYEASILISRLTSSK